MAAFLPVVVLLSLLATGATAGGYYGSQTTSSPSAPSAPTPPTPAPAAHGYDDDKKLVVVHVEGVVLCQSCEKKGSQSLDGATPLPRANVTVTCRDRKNCVMAYRQRATDDNAATSTPSSASSAPITTW